MYTKHWFPASIGVALLFTMPGCATVMSGRHADVSFYSNVPNAAVVIRDKRGEQVIVAQAQSKVALKRKDRYIFPARYTATFVAPGYQPVDVPIQSKVNPWILGNVAFGYAGLAGLAIDNATGAAWSPKEGTIYQELSPLGSNYGPAFSSTIPANSPIFMATAPTHTPINQAIPVSATLPVGPTTYPNTYPNTPAATVNPPQAWPGSAILPGPVAPAKPGAVQY